MNRKGFTLTELLVVIAIIGVLSVIIIPSVVKINEGINEREYEQRKSYIETAAESYASDKPDIFQGEDEAYVYVWQLVSEGYLNTDLDSTDEACNYVSKLDGSELTEITADSDLAKTQLSAGCVSDPRNASSLNSKQVKLTRKTVGVVAELVDEEDDNDDDGGIDTLVGKVCAAIDSGRVKAQSLNGSECKCKRASSSDPKSDVIGLTGDGLSCIISSTDTSGNVDNWLKYGSSTANWRVVGLYFVPKSDSASSCTPTSSDCEVVAKMITSGVVD